MNLLGLNWPEVNEDKVHEFAGHVRTFGRNMDATHQAAGQTVRQLGAYYQADSYERLASGWAQRSSSHMTEMIKGCEITATALDVAADGIVAMKTAIITELGIMAAEFIADQAAAVATAGAAEAAEALLIAATKKVVNGLIKTAEEELVGALVNKAIAPLEQVAERALTGLAFEGVKAALDQPGEDMPAPGSGSGQVGEAICFHPDQMMRHAELLHGHAREVHAHGSALGAVATSANFS